MGANATKASNARQDMRCSKISTWPPPVCEALEFSALLRQPTEYSHDERLAYVDHVIDLLEMQEYADAVVGVPGSGLNVERESSISSAR